MRIITETKLKDYAEAHPDAKTALQEWSRIVKAAEWRSFADIKNLSTALMP